MRTIPVVVVLLAASSVIAQPDSLPQPKELDPKVVQRWEAAGAKYGWLCWNEFGQEWFAKEKPEIRTCVRAFELNRLKPGMLVELPAPSNPFGLHIRDHDVPDIALEGLERFPTLYTLHVVGVRLSKERVKQIAALKGLRRLALTISSGPSQENGGDLRDLAQLTNLESLFVYGGGLPVRINLGALAKHQNLTFLGLEGWRAFEREGGVTEDVMKEVATLSKLRALYLASSTVSENALQHLERLKQLHALDLSDTDIGDIALKQIGKLVALKYLRLGPETSDRGMQDISSLRLEVLDLRRAKVTDDGLKALGAQPKLRTLYVDGKITNVGLAAIGAFQSLEYLDLANTNITDHGLTKLVNLKQLRILFLDKTRITEEGLKEIATLDKLHTLSLAGTRLRGQWVKSVSRVGSLDLSDTTLTPDVLKQLAMLPDLEHLRLRRVLAWDVGVKNTDLRGLAEIRKLRSLDISEMNVAEEELQSLASLKSLVRLIMNDTRIVNPRISTNDSIDAFRKMRPDVEIIRRFPRIP
jgi:Leucine-rich repeat (LRR) protein